MSLRHHCNKETEKVADINEGEQRMSKKSDSIKNIISLNKIDSVLHILFLLFPWTNHEVQRRISLPQYLAPFHLF
jgi:hypothetical protein